MKKNYYRIAIERYFSTPVPYFLIGTVPLMLYGYYESDLWFWVGMVLTIAVFAVNHLMMHSLTSTFGLYATKKQVDYVSNFCVGKNEVFSEQESNISRAMPISISMTTSTTSIISWRRSRARVVLRRCIGWAFIIVFWVRLRTTTRWHANGLKNLPIWDLNVPKSYKNVRKNGYNCLFL